MVVRVSHFDIFYVVTRDKIVGHALYRHTHCLLHQALGAQPYGSIKDLSIAALHQPGVACS